MMSDSWVRQTLLLGGLSLLLLGTSSHAQEPPIEDATSIEMVRFRPLKIFSRLRSGEQEGRDASDESARQGLQEPLAAPPTARRRSPQEAEVSTSEDELDPILKLTLKAIDKTSHRYLDANQHRPWQIVHGLLALRNDFVLRDGRRNVNAIEWISKGATFRGQHWFEATEYGGRAHPYNGTPYEFEGHVNQTLALMALSNLPLSHRFVVAGGKTVTMRDMIQNAKMTVNTREEITWTLWFLTHYIDIDSEWINAAGEPWSLEELVRLQTEAKVVGAPCGGTHGLFALAYARNAQLHKHRRLRGVWFEADRKIKRYIELARSLQNFDGSFSTEYFKGPGHSRDFNERLKASGHMLEWLMMALPHERLEEAWVRRAVSSIATDMIHHAARPAECGPLYHALHSLTLYRDRVAPPKAEEPESLAQQPEQQPALTREASVGRANVGDAAPREPSLLDESNRLSAQPASKRGYLSTLDTNDDAFGEFFEESSAPDDSPYMGGGLFETEPEGPALEPARIAIEPDDGWRAH